MATTWYFRNTNAAAGPTGKASTDTDSWPASPADKNTPKDMTAASGAGQTSAAGVWTNATRPLYGMFRVFVGPALAAQSLTGGQAGYKVAVGIQESAATMNLYFRMFAYV